MLSLPTRTAVIFHDPEGGRYNGYVRSCVSDGANLTVFDTRYPDPAQKDDVPFDQTGRTPGTFKLDLPVLPVPNTVTLEAEVVPVNVVPFNCDELLGDKADHEAHMADDLIELPSPAGKVVVHENEVPVLDADGVLVNEKTPEE